MKFRAENIVSGAVKIVLLALFSTGLFFNCANPAAPQGGPRDTLPPKVVRFSPMLGKTNFEGKRIFIEFDEYIQLKDQQAEFYTSPKMKKKPTILIKGRGVEVTIQDTLRENTTYAFNFGSSIEDNNEGNKLHSFRYVMSTGDEIDSLVMTGYAEDAFEKDSASKTFIYFFPAEWDSIPEYDSLMFNCNPVAIGRAENNGIFIAQNLKPIPYRIYALQDENKNQEYEPGVDKVGFLDTIINPAELSGVEIWYDTMRMHLVTEPQVHFRMFKDARFRRQYFAESTRPLSNKVMMKFGADYPIIDTMAFEGFKAEEILIEELKPTRDSLALWFVRDRADMPDTLRGFVTYMMHDTLSNLVPDTKQVALVWRESKGQIEAREQREKERERAERAGEEVIPEPNPFQVSVQIGEALNPERHIPFEFEYPLKSIDSTAVTLVRTEGENRYRVRTRFVQDTVSIRKWRIEANWQPAQEYSLEIPAGTFVDVAGESNDTLKANFSVMDPEAYGKLVFNLIPKEEDSQYILQLLDDGGATIDEIKHATKGEHTFRYIKPGEVKLRVVEDKNKNGRWDEGNMVERRQPERVEMFVSEIDEQLITIRANWELSFDLDMNKVFEPVTMEMLSERLRKEEQIRLRKYIEELEKQGPKEEQRGRESGPQFPGGGGLGGFGGLGGSQLREF